MLSGRQIQDLCRNMLPELAQTTIPHQLDTNLLPQLMSNMVHDVSLRLQAAPELAIANAIGTAFVATLGRVRVAIPDSHGIVRGNACILSCAESGERKSGVQDEFKAPLIEWEDRRIEKGAQKRSADAVQVKIRKQQIKNLEKQITKKTSKGIDCDLDMENLQNLFKEMEEVGLPTIERLFISHDSTAAGIIQALGANAGVCSIYSDEGDLSFFIKDPLRGEIFRQAASGTPISITRATGNLTVPAPAFNYICSTQYTTLSNLAKLRDQAEYGSHARLWFICSPSTKGRRLSSQYYQYNTDVAEQWRLRITQLLEVAERLLVSGQKQTLTLQMEAVPLWKNFCDTVERRMYDGDLSPLPEWAGKASGGVLKLAGVLHFFDNPTLENSTISYEQLERAIGIYEWLTAHAKVAYSMMFPMRHLKHALDLMFVLAQRQHLPVFSAGQIINRHKRNNDKTEDWYQAIYYLEELGYIARQLGDVQSKGRPAKMYYLTSHFAATWDSLLKTLVTTFY